MKLHTFISLLILTLSLQASAQNNITSKLIYFQFPTNNHKLHEEPQKFYMYTNRSFEGKSSKPWQGGQYGYVRNLVRYNDSIVATKFHEGIDIAPIYRDKIGNPLDQVRPIFPGKVMHCNYTASHSSYGKYVVLTHDLPSGTYYSLYAHLNEIHVKKGQFLNNSSKLGTLGFTGVGIDKPRSHLHLEFGLILSKKYEKWHKKHFDSSNNHKIYNGINFAGLPINSLIRASQDQHINIANWTQNNLKTYYQVLCTRKSSSHRPSIIDYYPWLTNNQKPPSSPSWLISFSSSGIPLKFEPSWTRVSTPKIHWITKSWLPPQYRSRNRIINQKSIPKLTESGVRYVELVSENF